MIYLNFYLKVKQNLVELNLENLFFLVTICCHSDLEIVSNLTYTLILLLFDRSLHINSLTDQEFQQQIFAVDFLLVKK